MFFHRVPLFEEDSLWIQSFLTLLAVRDTSRETLDKTSVTAGRVERHLYCLVCVPSKKIMEGVIYNFDRGLPYPGLGKGIADNRCITEPNTARDGALWKIESEGFTFCQHPCKIRPKDPNFVTFFEEKNPNPPIQKTHGWGWHAPGCQLPTSSNIENWQGRDNRWCHNARNMTTFVQKSIQKNVVGIVPFVPDWFTSHQSHYCLYYNGIPGFLRKGSMLNSSNNAKYLKFGWQKVESIRNCKLRQLSGRFQTLIWRPGETVQNLESSGLSGRVDSTAVRITPWRRLTWAFI